MEGTQLTAEEKAQFLQEAAALSGGTIPESADTTEAETTDNSEESQDTEGSQEEEVSESKTEKKIKKLLSKKNQAEKRAETLEEKVARLEAESEKNKFLAEYPDAKEYVEKIDDFMEQKPGYSREDAFLLLQARGDIAAPRTSNKFAGRPATGLSTPKDPTKLGTDEMKSYLKENYSAGGFNGLI